MQSLRISSMNCRGLADKIKRVDVFEYMKKRFDIVCLQDVHIAPDIVQAVSLEWGGKAVISPYRSNARGVAVLFNGNFEYKIHKIKVDTHGNYIVIDLTLQDHKITLLNLYGPNQDSPNFYTCLRDYLTEFENRSIIMCGDFNLVLQPEKDSKGYIHTNNPNARNEVLDIMGDLNLVDIWRLLYPDKKRYTWRSNVIGPRKQSRLDFFLVSEDLSNYITDAKILSGYRTDHSAVSIEIKLTEATRGRGHWKFNNTVLKEQAYVNQIKQVIEDTIRRYAVVPYNFENILNIPLSDICFRISDQLFLETLMMEIRSKTISYSAWRKKEITKAEERLEQRIQELHDTIQENSENVNQADYQEYINCQEELREIRAEKIKGSILRSKAQQLDEDEKPSRFFFDLEKQNFVSKCIPKLCLGNGQTIFKQDEILQEQQRYYETLYSDQGNLNHQIPRLQVPKLTDDIAESIEGPLTYKELTQALKRTKNNKSPGIDGFTIEFFKFFWINLGHLVLRSINEGYELGEMSVSQRRGIITCIPKTGKSRFLLKNWRPISLLTVIYKLASSCIATRMRGVMGLIIHEDQKGFLEDRFIGENIRMVYDTLLETHKQNLPGILLLIDFEKAFDSISWPFIQNTLKSFNFGPSICRWVNTFYQNIESAVVQNGHMSQFFKIKRGCRQGDPLSPYLFLLGAEILGLMIRQNNNIKGIVIDGQEIKIGQYADDTQLFLDGTEISLRETFQTLDLFYRASGLKINIEKTQAVWIGSRVGSREVLCLEYKLDWTTEKFRILGVNFMPNVLNIWDLNYPEKVLEVKRLLGIWSGQLGQIYSDFQVLYRL